MRRLRLRYAKRGRLRFTSHRDFARAFERALRRADIPIAYSAGFTPHPKVSYLGAAPTGVASEAEYLEIGLDREVDPADVRAALDSALPDGLDVLDAVVVTPTSGALADRIDASAWRIALVGVERTTAQAGLDRLLAAESVPVERRTKSGRRTVDVRAALVSAVVLPDQARGEDVANTRAGVSAEASHSHCAILECVVRHVTPAVRPDDILTGLRHVADLVPSAPPRATRLAQGALTFDGKIADPLDADRGGTVTGAPR